MGNGIDDEKSRYSTFTIIPIDRTYGRDYVSRLRGKKTWDYWEVRGLCDSHESLRLAHEDLRRRAAFLEQDVLNHITLMILIQRGYALGSAASIPADTLQKAREDAQKMLDAIHASTEKTDDEEAASNG
jgi:hypothetical protein